MLITIEKLQDAFKIINNPDKHIIADMISGKRIYSKEYTDAIELCTQLIEDKIEELELEQQAEEQELAEFGLDSSFRSSYNTEFSEYTVEENDDIIEKEIEQLEREIAMFEMEGMGY